MARGSHVVLASVARRAAPAQVRESHTFGLVGALIARNAVARRDICRAGRRDAPYRLLACTVEPILTVVPRRSVWNGWRKSQCCVVEEVRTARASSARATRELTSTTGYSNPHILYPFLAPHSG